MHKSHYSTASQLRSMILSGLFAALGIVLQVFSVSAPLIRVGISPIPTIVAGLLLGPAYGAGTGLLKDVVGFMVAPPASGSFFPPITIIQMLYGILPPLLLLLFRRPVDWIWGRVIPKDDKRDKGARWLSGLSAGLATCFLVVGLTQLICGGLLMPGALSLLYDGKLTQSLWLARFTPRLLQQLLSLVAYPLITYVVLKAFERIPVWGGVARETVLSKHS